MNNDFLYQLRKINIYLKNTIPLWLNRFLCSPLSFLFHSNIGMDKITSRHCQAIIYRKFGGFVLLPSAAIRIKLLISSSRVTDVVFYTSKKSGPLFLINSNFNAKQIKWLFSFGITKFPRKRCSNNDFNKPNVFIYFVIYGIGILKKSFCSTSKYVED